MKKKAFGLTEILVGAILLATTVAGLLASFTAARSYVKRANKRLVAANLIRSVFNDLYRQVRQNNWGTGNMKLGTNSLVSYNIDGLTYGAGNNYQVSAVAGRDYRRVTATIFYPDD